MALLWVGDNEVMCLGRRWMRWDVRSGKTVDDREAGFPAPGPVNQETGEGCLSEDGKVFWIAEADRERFRGRLKKIRSWDFAAGEWQAHGEILTSYEYFGAFGLIPGGQYVHVGAGDLPSRGPSACGTQAIVQSSDAETLVQRRWDAFCRRDEPPVARGKGCCGAQCPARRPGDTRTGPADRDSHPGNGHGQSALGDTDGRRQRRARPLRA